MVRKDPGSPEPAREDAEVALLAAVEDPRLHGLVGHHMAIALLQVLDDAGWVLSLRADPENPSREW